MKLDKYWVSHIFGKLISNAFSCYKDQPHHYIGKDACKSEANFFFKTTKMSREKTIKSIFTVSHTFGLFTYKSKTLLRWVKEEGNGCQII